MERRLFFIKSNEAKLMAESANSKIEYFIYQSLINNGIRILQSEINWVDESLHEIDIL